LTKLRPDSAIVELSGQAFGVGVTLAASDRELIDRLRAWLPPAWHEG